MAGLIAEASYTVHLFDTDAHGTLCVRGLWDFLQETAGVHTQILGVAPEDLRPQGLAWILSRLRVQVQRYPALGERVTVHTWPTGFDRLFTLRDFAMRDSAGSVIASAASAWLAIKLDTLRPIRVQTIFNPPGMDSLPRALEVSMQKLPGPSAPQSESAFRVRFGDLDANRHVGNSRYVEWVVESAGRALLEGSMIAGLGIDFISETPYGGDVIVRTQTDPQRPGRLEHAVVRTSDGGESARARTEWRPR
jgi:medium-chain acyl-[acyl-carrier-protein] hydrolase